MNLQGEDMSKIQELARLGQSIWFDYIQRSFITSGELQELIDQGLRGITSNPAIFEKAIAGSSDYDEELHALVTEDKSVKDIYEALAIKDISLATDLLKPVYHATEGLDGYVSLEVSPDLARDTEATITEAKRLFQTLQRPNVMIKVPATPAGIPAVRQLIAAGVNINVTLMFALENYRDVAEAYIQGLEILAQDGPSVAGGLAVDKVASVASFFVSRVDTAVDAALQEIGNESLKGKIAIANAKATYAAFQQIYQGSRWEELKTRGARVQRPLWASTGTKNPRYSDTLYVDQLIGPHTVNTIPPATLNGFLDHGTVAQTLTEGLEEALSQLAELEDAGIDLDAITQKLQDDGVIAFADAFDALMASVSEKQDRLLIEK
jgi:transaldolase